MLKTYPPPLIGLRRLHDFFGLGGSAELAEGLGEILQVLAPNLGGASFMASSTWVLWLLHTVVD